MGDSLRERVKAALDHDERVGRPTPYPHRIDDITGFLRAARTLLPECARELERLEKVEAAAQRSEERWLHDAQMRTAAEKRLAIAREAMQEVKSHVSHQDGKANLGWIQIRLGRAIEEMAALAALSPDGG